MTERQSARMSKSTKGGLDQYGAEPFEQRHVGISGIKGVKMNDDDERQPIRPLNSPTSIKCTYTLYLFIIISV